jgi:hypothetical protein
VLRKIEVNGDVDSVDMYRLKEEYITNIKTYLYSGVLKHPTGALANSIRGYVVDNYIIVYSDKQYAEAVDEGVKPHIMFYLVGKTIHLNGVFRRVTIKSIAEGKWRHPGTSGVHYLQTALEYLQTQHPNYNIDWAKNKEEAA